MYPQLMGHLAKKRKLNSPPPTRLKESGAALTLSPSAKKRAKKQEAKAKAANRVDKEERDKRAAQSARDKAAARGRGGKGGGAPGGGRGRGGAAPDKGAGKGLPDGAVRINPNTNKEICFGYSKGNRCTRTPCNFEHVCWFCFGNHPGKDCELARGPAPAPGR